MKYTTSPSNLGTVLSVRGSVVDVQLNGRLPPIYSLLHAKEGTIALRSWRNSTSILFLFASMDSLSRCEMPHMNGLLIHF
jgi:F0F1-type ATP synthase beta subunit